MFCTNCGSRLPDGYKFCPKCGAQITSAAPQPDPPKKSAPSSGKSVNLLLVGAIAAAVLLVVGIAAGIFLLSDGWRGDDRSAGAVEDEQDEDSETGEDEIFDSVWTMTARWEYKNDGTLKRGSEYSYDILGRLVKEQRYNDQGVAHQYDEYVYDLTGGYTKTTYINESGRTYIIDSFNAAGEPLLHSVYDEDSTESVRYEYTYDEKGLLISKDSLERRGEVIWREEYHYDIQGNEVAYYGIRNGIEQSHTFKAYDQQGNLIWEERTVNPEVNPYEEVNRYEYTYDENNNLLKKQFVYGGENREYWEYTYDEENRLLFYGHYNSFGELGDFKKYTYTDQGLVESYNGYLENTYPAMLVHYVYEYNEDGQETLELSYDRNGDLICRTYTEYNASGDPAHIRCVDPEDRLKYETIFTYDSSGNLLSQCFTDENNEVGDTTPSYTLHEYTYDEFGNMTSEKYYYNRETMEYHYEYEYAFLPTAP